MADEGIDLLWTTRNAFYVGAHQAAIAEAADLDGLGPADKLERDVFVYRAYVELGSYEIVLNEVADDAPQPLLAVRLLARLRSSKVDPEAAAAQLAEWTAPGGPGAADPTTRAVAATLRLAAGDPVAALQACHGLTGAAPELAALSVQALLALDRPDAAERAARALGALDDDAALSHLAAAWVGTALGGARAAEAGTILEELGDRFGWTARLAAAGAAAALRRRDWGGAERLAGEALGKDARSGDALANAAVAALHAGKASAASRHLAALKAAAPGHPLMMRLATAEEAFDRAAGGVTV